MSDRVYKVEIQVDCFASQGKYCVGFKLQITFESRKAESLFDCPG